MKLGGSTVHSTKIYAAGKLCLRADAKDQFRLVIPGFTGFSKAGEQDGCEVEIFVPAYVGLKKSWAFHVDAHLISIPRPVYKPHSVSSSWKLLPGDHLSGPCVSTRLMQPTRNGPLARRERAALQDASLLDPLTNWNAQGHPPVPAWPCSWRRLPGHADYSARRWSLTPPFHPYRLYPAVCFCGPIRQVSPPRDFPRRHALWSADFPRAPRLLCYRTRSARDRPTNLGNI